MVTMDQKLRAKLLGEILPLGHVMWWLGVVRFYRDGDWSLGMVLRWWNPLAWVVWLVALQVCGIVGAPVNEVMPFRLRPYWRTSGEPVEWFTLWPSVRSCRGQGEQGGSAPRRLDQGGATTQTTGELEGGGGTV